MRANAVACLVYAVIVIGCGLGIYLTLQAGMRLEPAPAAPLNAAQTSVLASANDVAEGWWQVTRDALREPLPLLLIQLILIVTLARFFGAHSGRLGQPAVIGEMIAGIVLGPSVLGALAPGIFHC